MDDKSSPKGACSRHTNHLNFGGHKYLRNKARVAWVDRAITHERVNVGEPDDTAGRVLLQCPAVIMFSTACGRRHKAAYRDADAKQSATIPEPALRRLHQCAQ